MLSRSDAQKRADLIRSFYEEIDALRREGQVPVSDETLKELRTHHDALLADYARHFDIDRDAQTHQLSLGMRLASFLGALCLSASVFFLFYRFWGFIPTTTQVVILIGAALGTFILTIWLQSRDRTGYFAQLGALLAFACFVLNISMLGQIFNITPSDKALLPWAALAFVLAYSSNSRLLLFTGISCSVAFISARVGTWSGLYWIDFGERPENFIPAAIALVLAPHFVSHRRWDGFDVTYRVCGMIMLFLPMLLLANWGRSSYLPWDPDFIEGFYQVAGFALSALAIWIGVRRHWPHVINTGVTFFVIFLFTKFYDWWWETMPKWLFFLVLGLTAVLFLFVLRRLRTVAQPGEPA